MNYAYIRVSSKDQKLDRQVSALKKWSEENQVNMDECFADKESGKNFERENYQRLRNIIKNGDLLVIKSIDRLGRNYDMIIQEWSYITKTIGADIVVIDMPLLDTRQKKDNLTGKFVADMVLQILSYVAQTERENTKIRQAEGIRIAREKGVKLGRKETYSEELKTQIRIDYEKGMSYNDLVEKYGCSKAKITVWKNQYSWKKRNHKRK